MAYRKQWTDADKAQWQAQTEARTASFDEWISFLSEISAPCRNRWNALLPDNLSDRFICAKTTSCLRRSMSPTLHQFRDHQPTTGASATHHRLSGARTLFVTF